MLDLRPNCEWCDCNLPPDSTHAMICSYECTFCSECVETLLDNVCPNCGGGFSHRPIRPRKAYRQGVSLQHQLPSTKRVHSKYSVAEIAAFVRHICNIRANER
ncbi:MAG: DUF1272 domain-containing protein [Pseudomonadota bacterium]